MKNAHYNFSDSSNYLICPIIYEHHYDKTEMLQFKGLEPANIWFFSRINDSKNSSVIKSLAALSGCLKLDIKLTRPECKTQTARVCYD